MALLKLLDKVSSVNVFCVLCFHHIQLHMSEHGFCLLFSYVHLYCAIVLAIIVCDLVGLVPSFCASVVTILAQCRLIRKVLFGFSYKRTVMKFGWIYKEGRHIFVVGHINNRVWVTMAVL